MSNTISDAGQAPLADDLRRRIWRAQYEWMRAHGEAISEEGIDALVERRIADPRQRGIDAAAFGALAGMAVPAGLAAALATIADNCKAAILGPDRSGDGHNEIHAENERLAGDALAAMHALPAGCRIVPDGSNKEWADRLRGATGMGLEEARRTINRVLGCAPCARRPGGND